MSETRPWAEVWADTMYRDTTNAGSSPSQSALPGTALNPATSASTEPWTRDINDLRLLGHIEKPRELYSPEVASRPVFLRYENTLRDELGYTTLDLQRENREHVADIRATRLDPYVFGEHHYEGRIAALKAAKAGVEADPAAMDAFDTQLRRELRERYGPQEAERLVRETEQFLSVHPKVLATMAMPGYVGSSGGQKAIREVVEFVRKGKHRR